MTFNAAHQYLGLTTELLRTEKAINELACHPLPRDFYEGGGMHSLRQRLDGIVEEDQDSDSGDYFTGASTETYSKTKFKPVPKSSKAKTPKTPVKLNPPQTPWKSHGSRHGLNAGDLLTMAGLASSSIYTNASSSSLHAQTISAGRRLTHTPLRKESRFASDEINLRDEVMSCIAKSIGLLQPPLSGSDSVEASPGIVADDSGSFQSRSNSRGGPLFGTSFGSLSLLETPDDSASSITNASSVADNVFPTGLDNEVEILFFAAGSYLVKGGERNAG